jgi:hypothetical protein
MGNSSLPTAAVLLLIFNRPNLTAKVLERIRAVKPAQLFIAADGPRPGNAEDAVNCKACRDLVSRIDWDCRVQTLYREENLGCGEAVSSAITWFFSQVEEGIILEDDCLPDLSFFPYCTELLEKYRDHPEVMTITGSRFHQPEGSELATSYDFSIYHHIWGWASWRRAWKLNRKKVPDSALVLDSGKLADLLQNPRVAEFWLGIAHIYCSGQIDTWDFPWVFSCWEHGGLSIRPQQNLISNLGYDQRATHTKNADPMVQALPTTPLPFPLNHPNKIIRNKPLEQESVDLFAKWLPSVPEAVKPGLIQCLIGKISTVLNLS